MIINELDNGMYRIKVRGFTVIAPSLKKAITVAWLYATGDTHV